MKWAAGGYTIIEVLMFLAISGLIFVTTMVAIRGQAAHSEFIAGTNDINTKLQQWINEVVTGYGNSSGSVTASATNYKCSPETTGPLTGYPKLTTGTVVARGTNPECIFLGKALQVSTDPANDQNTHIFSYTMLGRRTYTTAGGDIVNVDTLTNAKPIAAVFPQDTTPHGVADLTEDYKLPDGVSIISAKAQDPSNPSASASSNLAGIYTDLQGSSGSGSSDLNAVQYSSFTTNTDQDSSLVLKCLRLESCSAPAAMKNWVLCLGSGRSDDRAKLTIASNNGTGVFTRLETGKVDICS